MKKITFFLTFLFVLIFCNQSFSQAETEPNGTVSQTGTQTLTSATTITGAVLPFPDGADVWNINDGSSGSLIANWSDSNIKVSYVGYSDSGRTTLAVPATEMTSGVSVTLNSSTFYSINVSFVTFQPGTFSYSVDLSGTALPASDTDPPVVQSITESSSDNAASVPFTVTFDENANNISTDDFELNTTGTASGTIASVSATSGTSVTVTVNSITGTGTLRLDLKGSTDIADDSANAPPAAFNSATAHNVDRNAPAFSSLSPFSSVKISNANVGYTLSEDIASGTVTFTRTGGTADGSSPHVVSLTGTELNAGVRGQSALTNAPTLVNGAVYTISFDGVDAAGNNAITASVTNITFDNLAPTVTSIVRKTPTTQTTNATSVTFTVTFNETVVLVDATDFAISGNGAGGTATIGTVSGSGTTYDVPVNNINIAGLLDLDFASGQNIFDGAGNAFGGVISSEGMYTIDQTAPTLTNQALTQTDVDDLQITYQSNEPGILYYIVTTNSSTPSSGQIKAGNDQSGTSTNVVSSGNAAVTITGSDQTIALNGLTLTSTNYHLFIYEEDAAGNASSVVTNSVATDATAPSTVSFTRKTPSSQITNADALTFLATFSEDVTGVDNSDFTVTGPTGATISVSQVTASTYDVQVSGGDLANLNGTISLNFSSPSITDLAGNALPNTEPSTDETYSVDNSAPSTISFTRKTPSTQTTDADQVVYLVTFSEDVTGVDSSDFSVVGPTGASIGVTQVTASTYDVTISGGNLANYNGPIALNFGSPTITDVAGNALPNSEPPTDQLYTIDNAGPTVTSVTSSFGNGSYNAGVTIYVNINFNEDVTVTGSPTLQLETGTTDRIAVFDTATGSSMSFTYAVQPGDTSADLDYTSTTAFSLNGGTIQDALGNDATLTLPTPGATNSLGANADLVIDTTPPTGVISTPIEGEGIVNADEDDTVIVSGTVSEAVTNGLVTVEFDDGVNTKIQQIAPVTGNSWTSNATDISGLNNGNITVSVIATDLAGNTVTIDTQTIVLETTLPVINSTSPADNATGVSINGDITITFSENIQFGSGASTSIQIIDVTDGSNSVVIDTEAPGSQASISGSVLTLSPTNALDLISDYAIVIGADAIDDMAGNSFAGISNGTTFNFTTLNQISASVNDPIITEGNAGNATLTFTVSLDSPAPAGGATINFATSDGTATAGSDYSSVSGTLNFAAGDTSKTVNVSVIGDSTLEANETFTLTLSNPTGANVVIGDATGTATITNDDEPLVTLSVDNSSINEASGTATLTATLSGVFDKNVTVMLSYSGTATNGTDYNSSASTSITINAGSTSASATVGIVATNDTTPEFNETIIVDITSITNGIEDGTQQQTITILDDDTPNISFTSAASSGLESVSSANLSVDLSAVTPFTVTVDYAVSGTANSGTDYTLTTGTLTINPGSLSQNITIASIVDDAVFEADETVIVTLSNPSNAVLGTNTSHTYTITNNDNAAITIADVSGNENNGAITLTATLDNAVQGGFTVALNTVDGTATAADFDYSPITNQTLTFTGNAGETQIFTVMPTADTKLEADETFTVGLNNLSGTSLAIDITDTATVTINNDDTAAITIADVSGNEDDGGITVTATLDNAVQGGISVVVSTQDGTATLADNDYTAVSFKTLNFTGNAGETQTLTVTPTADTKTEADETITVVMSNITKDASSVDISDTATVTIIDDDAPVVAGVSLSQSSGVLKLGDHLDLTVTFSSSVTITGVPSIPLQIGSGTLQAPLNGTVTGSTTAVFRYTVSAGDLDVDGIDFGGAINLNGGTIKESTRGNDAILTLNNTDSPEAITVDGIVPTVTLASTVGSLTNTSFDVMITLSEAPVGFTVSDITVVNGVASNLQGSGTSYTATITPSTDNQVEVSIASEVFTDAADNANTGSNTITTNYDGTRPTVTVSTTTSITNAAFTATITFSESVTGFELSDLVVGNGVASNLQGRGTVYTATITPANDGDVTLDVAENVANDAATNGNTAATQHTVLYDATVPTVSITSTVSDPTNSSFDVTITFSESVTGLELSDLNVGNGVASNLQGSGTTYTATITPSSDGGVIVFLPENVANDTAGNGNDISNEFSVGYDATTPTVMLSTTAPNPTNSPFTVAINFSEAVLGFEMDDLIVTNGTPSAFTGSGTSYSVLITPTQAGLVIVDVIEGVAEDAAGNENTAGTFELEFDNIAPYPPQITHISDYTCSGTVAMTGDNTLEISGSAERQSTVEMFINGVSIGTVVADANTGFFTFDYTSTALADGSYTFTARATDVSTNTGDLSAPFSITINTVDSDGDGTPDFCDDDNGNNGEVDTEEDCDGDGIINSEDSDNSTCREPIDQTRTYGFSPNGDGINEGWVIENIEAFPNNTVSVFSRSGKLVFKEKGYKNTWQGDSNQINSNGLGRKLPVGPYIYVIDLGDGGRPIRGWLYINY